ncbi:MAG TPA: calcium/proton exchanger, partial [Gaiellaceae bacterium]|nr:calcium/proton exchanger [Gaiellaceae bacterium]
SLVLAPITFVLRYVFHAGDVTLFVFAAASLVPLAWLIGEATEQAGEHTGPGIGGFLNASFGNAPELIIALFAVNQSLPNVVRASLMGSVVSNILLVLGAALIFGGNGGSGKPLDRLSMLPQLGLVLVASALFLIPSVPGWTGDADRHSLAVLTIPVAVVLLLLYLAVTTRGLRRHKQLHEESGEEAAEGGWSLTAALAALAAATVVTALVSETLVHSLHSFAEAAGLSEFFISAVIVAIVGNAAEHGGAVVIAHRGKLPLATEIAVSSSAQVALLVTPVVALLSWIVRPPLPLAFRPIELAAMGGSALLVSVLLWDGRGRRWEGWLLAAVYAGVAVGFFAAGDR